MGKVGQNAKQTHLHIAIVDRSKGVGSYRGLLATRKILYLYHSKKESGVIKMKYLGGQVRG